MPDHAKIRANQRLNQVFGTLLHDPNLLHLNRRSVSSAFAIGLFMAFMPVPFQMVLAAAAAIIVRSNLPISVALVWISNPLTMPAMFFFAYKIGTLLLGTPMRHVDFELSLSWLGNELLVIWQPFLLGCFVTGIVSGALGYITVRVLWRLHLTRYLNAKKIKWAAMIKHKRLLKKD